MPRSARSRVRANLARSVVAASRDTAGCHVICIRTSQCVCDEPCSRQNGGGPRISIAPVATAAACTRPKSTGVAGSPSIARSLAWR